MGLSSWQSVHHGDFSYHPFASFTCGKAIPEVWHLEIIFISCPYLSFLRKKLCSKDKLKGKAWKKKKKTRSDLSANTREMAASSRPQELIFRQDRAVEHGVTTRRSQIFGNRRVCSDWFFCRTFASSHCRLCCGSGLALPLASMACSRLAF